MPTFNATANLQAFSSAAATAVVATLGLSASLTAIGSASANLSANHYAQSTMAATSRAKAVFSEDMTTGQLVAVAKSTLSVSIPPLHREMTLYRLMREVYAVWGLEVSRLESVAFWQSRALAVINGAFQVMYSQAHRLDYFNRVPVTVTMPAAGSLTLDQDIQAVHGPVRMDGLDLRKVDTLAQFDNLGTYYFGDGGDPTEPMFYYIDPARQAALDSVQITLRVWPAPASDAAATFEATREPPRFTDYSAAAAEILPVPHKWVETVLLPLCRQRATADSLFKHQSVKPEIDAQYARALQILGLADPDKPNTPAEP